MIAIGISPSIVVAGSLPPIDPRTVAAFMAGAIWHPSLGVSAPDGDTNRTWTSQATAGTVIRTHGSFQPPQPGLAGNGAAVWTFGGTNGSLHYGTGGDTGVDASVRFSSQGVIAGWFKAGENDTAIHNMITQWGAGNDGMCRIGITTGQSSNANAMVVNGSDDGTGLEGDGSHRFKMNGVDIDYTGWNEFAWYFNYPGGVNYSEDGGNYSTKLVVTRNGVPIEQTGYSAPPAPFATPPAGPIMGNGLYSGASRFNIGGDYISSCWWSNIGVWQIGAVLISDGLVAPATVRRCMAWNAPA